MALTKSGFNNILKRLMASGDLSEELENDITSLRNDFDEKDLYLKKFGTVYEGEDIDNYDYIENEIVASPDESGYKQKYEDMKQRYLDRFFGTVPQDETVESIMQEQTEDVEHDGTEQTFDDLFEKREG